MGSVLLPILLITTVLCRSTGALVLLLAGLLILWLGTRSNSKLYLYALLLVAPTYYALRSQISGRARILSVSSKNISAPSALSHWAFASRAKGCLPTKPCDNPLGDGAVGEGTWVIGPDGRDQAPRTECGSSISGVTDLLVCRPGRP